ncbi:MAG TPA: hypothetical protein VK420_08840 [Longimicrobium sp.]|nr:hypothetical protein [Longimicrobium sp.]
MSGNNNVSGFSMSMKSTQSFSVTAFEGGAAPARPPQTGGCEPAAPSSSTSISSSASGSQASASTVDVKKLAGELKAISAEMSNKPTCGCPGKSAAPTSGASPAPTSGAPAPTSGAAPAGGTPPPGGADKAGAPGQAGQPGGAAGGPKGFQEILQKLMSFIQNFMKQIGMQGA